MHFLTQNRAIQLRETLKDTRATVVTPEDEGYPELISRWSEASEKEAVSWNLKNTYPPLSTCILPET